MKPYTKKIEFYSVTPEILEEIRVSIDKRTRTEIQVRSVVVEGMNFVVKSKYYPNRTTIGQMNRVITSYLRGARKVYGWVIMAEEPNTVKP